MSAYLDPEHVKSARKSHRCDWCGERIVVGEAYIRQRCFDDGDAGTTRMHVECRAVIVEDTPVGPFEFTPFSNPRGAKE